MVQRKCVAGPWLRLDLDAGLLRDLFPGRCHGALEAVERLRVRADRLEADGAKSAGADDVGLQGE
jgi:hypothetical protein